MLGYNTKDNLEPYIASDAHFTVLGALFDNSRLARHFFSGVLNNVAIYAGKLYENELAEAYSLNGY